ncbi:hypothetical protein EDD11_001188 [Mortierella claussenii]|nr:hypothetical protein EDD11_001188 [Mortierella claussenii]
MQNRASSDSFFPGSQGCVREHHPVHLNSIAFINQGPDGPPTRSFAVKSENEQDGNLVPSVAHAEEEKITSESAKESKNTPARQVSIRRTTNPNVKTTKTGKILHRPKKAGVSRKSTAYDRFLQQRSKELAKDRSELTAQQRQVVKS